MHDLVVVGFHKSYLCLCYIIAGESDARIVNDTTLIVARESDTACVTIELIDDEIAESAEFFILNITANNTLDVINGTTSIEITDNDGMSQMAILVITQEWAI